MKQLFTFLIAGFLSVSAFAQSKDYVKWSFTAEKKSDKEYVLTITATIDKPWHLYSQTTPDNGAQPTIFTFKTNPLLIMTGIPKENGKLVQKHEEVFNADVKYYEGTVQFVQTVKLKSAVKTNISGTVKYMICNDNLCLPPKSISFDLKLQ